MRFDNLSNHICIYMSLHKLNIFFEIYLIDAVCSVTWYFYHSGSESSQGRLGRMSVPSMSHCAVECFVHTQCQIFGYETAAGACYLHDGSFSSTSDSSSHASVRYFRGLFNSPFALKAYIATHYAFLNDLL